ncbi:hypothetical protein CPC08DRAFT_726805 [Agrocybe pediades]|nr:hypothetical protein CPC08DRAFT_726805 [Agrocybe pediades]
MSAQVPSDLSSERTLLEDAELRIVELEGELSEAKRKHAKTKLHVVEVEGNLNEAEQKLFEAESKQAEAERNALFIHVFDGRPFGFPITRFPRLPGSEGLGVAGLQGHRLQKLYRWLQICKFWAWIRPTPSKNTTLKLKIDITEQFDRGSKTNFIEHACDYVPNHSEKGRAASSRRIAARDSASVILKRAGANMSETLMRTTPESPSCWMRLPRNVFVI